MGTFGQFAGALGMQAAQTGLGGAMGLILGGIERKKQLEQQRKLQALQIEGAKQMGIFNREQQMQLWKDTNYSAQMEELKKAGLNPGLLYGHGGPGGSTSASPGAVSGAQAAAQGPAMGMGISMGSMQLQLLKAQKDNIEADTALKQADTTKTAGVDTQLGEQTIEKLKQDIKSQQTQNALTEVQTAIASIQEHIAGQTQNMEISKIASATKIIQNDATISDATRDTIITTIKRQSLQVYLENQLLKSQKTLTDEQLKVAKTSISKMVNDMVNDDKRTSIEDFKSRIMESEAFRAAQQAGDIDIDDIMRNIGILLPIPTGKTHQPIRGFHQR